MKILFNLFIENVIVLKKNLTKIKYSFFNKLNCVNFQPHSIEPIHTFTYKHTSIYLFPNNDINGLQKSIRFFIYFSLIKL